MLVTLATCGGEWVWTRTLESKANFGVKIVVDSSKQYIKVPGRYLFPNLASDVQCGWNL